MILTLYCGLAEVAHKCLLATVSCLMLAISHQGEPTPKFAEVAELIVTLKSYLLLSVLS